MLICCLCFNVTVYAETSEVTCNTWEKVKDALNENASIKIDVPPDQPATVISIPNNVKNLTLIGDKTKTYTGLQIKTNSNRTDALTLMIKDLNISEGTIDIAQNTKDNILIFSGSNKITSLVGPAIVIENGDNKLTIQGMKDNDILNVTGGYATPGIGTTALGNSGGHLTISSGTIIAQGGTNASGIGSSKERAIKSITITDNAIIESSKGDGFGAGIGGNCDRILIDKNAKILDAIGGNKGGAGIGSAHQSGVRIIDILGGTIGYVTDTGYKGAVGGPGGAGIGSGTQDTMDITITIKDAIIYSAKGGSDGAGIGGGSHRGADINITGKTVIYEAIGGTNAAGIGSGPLGTNKTITISGNTLIKLAQGGNNGAGIGGGNTRNPKINITGGNIEYAKGGSNAAGIGGGYASNESNPINISGGVIYAEGGSGTLTNDIGAANYDNALGGKSQDDAKIVKVNITGGTVFTPNNTMIGKSESPTHKNYVLVPYTDYDVEKGTGTKMSNKTVRLRTRDNMDKEIDLNKDGRTIFSWENPVTALGGYWLQIDDKENNKLYIGIKAVSDQSKWKEICYDKHNNIVDASSPAVERRVTEIPVVYKEGTQVPFPEQRTMPNIDFNAITPYSVSYISYGIDLNTVKSTDPQILLIKKLESTLDLNVINTFDCQVEFKDTAKATIMQPIAGKMTFVDKKDDFKFTLADNKIATVCTGDWLLTRFNIVALLPTQSVKVKNASGIYDYVPYNVYLSDYVTGGKTVRMPITDIKVTVDRQNLIMVVIDGVDTYIEEPIKEEIITLPNSYIDLTFKEIPKIN